MTANPEYDATVRHAVYVERHKAAAVKRILAAISGITGQLYREITASDLDQLTRREVDALLKRVDRIVTGGYGPITADINATLREFGAYEASWQSGMLTRAGVAVGLGIASNADIWAAVNARPFEGKLLKDWVAGLSPNTFARLEAAITQGYVDGVGPLELARRIRGTRAQPGIMDISRRGAEAMVRTAMNHTASAAKAESYKGRNGIKEVQWVSVLDGRTTVICRGRDGNIYPKDEGPRPPAHVGCRSTVIPVTNGNRAKLQERETYADWFKRQGADVQDDILGPKRGKLYRDGGYPLDRFSDTSGKQYTLDALKAKDADTFKEVFGD